MKKIFKTAAYYALRFIGYIILKLFFGIEVRGTENIPKKGPFILVSNHISYVDPMAVHAVSKRQLRFFMTADWYYDTKWKWFYDFFGCIPLEEGMINTRAIERAIRVILSGDPFVIFPEGGISRSGKITTWHPGVGLLALSTGVPVIPVIIRGTSDVLPIGSSRLYFKPLKVFAGKQLIFDREMKVSFTRDETREATRRIRSAFIALAREEELYDEIIGPEAEREMDL